MTGDYGFDMNSLSPETRVWYERFLAALENPNRYPNVERAASSGDLYQLGRTVGTNVTTILTVFRLTGDLRLLDHVDQIMQIARGQLRDTNGDGYPNWRWLHDRRDDNWYGDDRHVMDEIMTHAMVSQVAWTYRQNRELTSPSGIDYGERAGFWARYLDQWEEKWRERSGVATGFPFIYSNLTHPHLNLIRFHWYSYRLTNDDSYLVEATQLADRFVANEMRSITTSNGPGLVFPHGVIRFEPNLDYLAPLNYAEYSAQVFMDLAFEGFEPFSPESTLVMLANTIATKVIDNGSQDFAPTIGGSEPIGGLDMPRGERRTSASQWAIFPLAEYAAFDATGTIAAVNQQVYEQLERRNLDRPSRIAIPAAMIIAGLMDGG